jgi:hypothetical protein
MYLRYFCRRKNELLATAVLCLAIWPRTGLAQTAPPVILHVDLENYVQYWEDSDPSKFATNPNQTTLTGLNTFMTDVHLADVVAVDGRPAKGTFVARTQLFRYNPSQTPGQSIADISRNGGRGTAVHRCGLWKSWSPMAHL